jgi:pentatricopeptide repeat protein
MLNCRGCLRRALRAVIAESNQRLPHDTFSRRPLGQVRTFARSYPRSAAVVAAARSTTSAHTPPFGENGTRYSKPSHARRSRQNGGVGNIAEIVQRALRPTQEQLQGAKAAALRELRWRNDPFELASYIRGRLQHPDPRTVLNTLELVRAASGRMECVVSWNHIVDYFISNGEVEAAMKIFNEVGKHPIYLYHHSQC